MGIVKTIAKNILVGTCYSIGCVTGLFLVSVFFNVTQEAKSATEAKKGA